MSNKAELLRQIANLGVPTPEDYVGTRQELAQVSLVADMFYYCRTLDPEKITVVPRGRDVMETLTAAAAPDRTWSVQTLYDFDVAGAALLTSSMTYVESIWGSPLALLREGLVSYRAAQDFDTHSIQSIEYVQDFQIRFFQGIPHEIPRPEQPGQLPDVTGRRIGCILEQIRSFGVLGFFEWGSKGDRAFILEWKPMREPAHIHRLQEILDRPPMIELTADYERPALKLVDVPSINGRIVFDHGARLSHVVTRAVEATTADILFRT